MLYHAQLRVVGPNQSVTTGCFPAPPSTIPGSRCLVRLMPRGLWQSEVKRSLLSAHSAILRPIGDYLVKMIRMTGVLLASLIVSDTALAATTAELTAPIHQFIDGFNTGDVKSAYASYASGDITIIDEFAPHRWTGPKAPQEWAAEYDKHARATGVSEGLVKYSDPTRTEVEGNVAYVVVPTVYLYKERGQSTAEEGQMTFVLARVNGAWKIKSWTWSGVPPHPAK